VSSTTRGRALAATLAALTLVAAGCGGEGEGGSLDTERLDGGRAQGAGFTFELSEDWSSVQDTDALERGVARESDVPGLDVGAGVELAGAWVLRSDEENRPSVNVTVEPVTRDTSLQTIAAGSAALLRTSSGADVTPRPATRLGGSPAAALAYSTDEDGEPFEKRFVLTQRGDYAYGLTAQMRTRDGDRVDELVERIVSSWRWREPSAAERRKLAGLSAFRGTGYRVTLPPGWRGTGKEALAETGQLEGVDSLWRGHMGERTSTNVNVGAMPQPGDDLDEVLEQVEESERTNLSNVGAKLHSIERGPRLRLGGEPAASLDLESTVNGERLRHFEVVVLHARRAYRVTLSGAEQRHATDRREFLATLRTWRWE
jgi:hypothetical protein